MHSETWFPSRSERRWLTSYGGNSPVLGVAPGSIARIMDQLRLRQLGRWFCRAGQVGRYAHRTAQLGQQFSRAPTSGPHESRRTGDLPAQRSSLAKNPSAVLGVVRPSGDERRASRYARASRFPRRLWQLCDYDRASTHQSRRHRSLYCGNRPWPRRWSNSLTQTLSKPQRPTRTLLRKSAP